MLWLQDSKDKTCYGHMTITITVKQCDLKTLINPHRLIS